MIAAGGCVFACTLAGGGTEEDRAWLEEQYESFGCGDLPTTVQDLAASCPAAVPACASDAPCLRELQAALASDGDVGPGSDLFNAIGHCFFSKEHCGENHYLCWLDDGCRAVTNMEDESEAEIAAMVTAAQALTGASARLVDKLWDLSEQCVHLLR